MSKETNIGTNVGTTIEAALSSITVPTTAAVKKGAGWMECSMKVTCALGALALAVVLLSLSAIGLWGSEKATQTELLVAKNQWQQGHAALVAANSTLTTAMAQQSQALTVLLEEKNAPGIGTRLASWVGLGGSKTSKQ